MRCSDSRLLPEESFHRDARGGGCEEDGICPPPFGEMWKGTSYMQERKACVSVCGSKCASQCTSSSTLALALTKPMNYRVGCTHGQPLIDTILTLLRDVRVRSNEG